MHTLDLVLDLLNEVSESDESDNQYRKTFTVTVAPSPRLHVSGPSSADAFEALTFTASASNCTPHPFGWSWAGDADLVYDPGLGVGDGAGASSMRGWTLPGRHLVEVRNSACPGVKGVASVEISFPTVQEVRLYPETPQSLPNVPTVVFCHGLQKPKFDSHALWSCVSGCERSKIDYPVGTLLNTIAAPTAMNKLQFVWSGAGKGTVWADEYIRAWEFVHDASRRLADMLAKRLPADYDHPIQFVGHSLGSVVCGRAATQFLNSAAARKVSRAQLTVLDRPDHVGKLLNDSRFDHFEDRYGFGASFFPALLGGNLPAHVEFHLDNYWASTFPGGVGDASSCVDGATTYNHTLPNGLLDPGGSLGPRYFPHEGVLGIFNDHSGVHQWYRWTIDPNTIAGVARDPQVCTGTIFTAPPAKPGLPKVNDTLDPCMAGWPISIVGPAPRPFPTPECESATVTEESLLRCSGSGPQCTTQLSEIWLEAVSSGMIPAVSASSVPVEIPPYARSMLLTLEVANPRPSLWAAVLLDDVPIWSGTLASFGANRAEEIGPLPLYGLTGRRQLTLKVLGAGNAAVQLRDVRIQKILVPCEADDTLCIAAHRFRVEADWTDHSGNSGHAAPRYISADESGFMWFFDPSNLELVVKVLNGCSLNDRFWVFAAGLTDVAVRLTVTDTVTGAIKIYHSRKGTAFAPIQDTDAFATCRQLDATAAEEAPNLAAERQSTTISQPARLNRGRFDVTARWRTADGAGAGQLVPVTDDSGYLWFFDPFNVEVAVKVLDACSLNNRYWVFAAGLTDVQLDLTVTDTQTRRSVTYQSPLGQSFQPIQDTDALATCP